MPKKSNPPVESIRHQDKRANIPTEELRDFVVEEEIAPETMLYPRDPSLDPQLVWKGKDEQDRDNLAVPIVPIYIQEKIHPQAIINDLFGPRGSSEGWTNLRRGGSLPDRAIFRLQRRPARLRSEGRVLPARAELDESPDPRRFATGDGLTRREGRAQGKGSNHLPGSALRHQVWLQLASEYPEAGRQGR
jgi:hypothetical protein